MPRPDPKRILIDAKKLKEDRFSVRNSDILARRAYRFRKVEPKVPASYNDTTTKFQSAEIEEQGRQVVALVYAPPVIHAPPPTPEQQSLTTKMETFGHAAYQELEAANGTIGVRNTSAQVHDRFSIIYFGCKRKPYADQPKAPDDTEADDYGDQLFAFDMKNKAYKKEAGIASVFDLRHVPTETFMYVGNYRNPVETYEWKEVDERELIATYGLSKDPSTGTLRMPDGESTIPSGTLPESGNQGSNARKITVVEYWDREWCMIVAQNVTARWMGIGKREDGIVLESWQHGWGRVPYFCAPAFENESQDEALRYESPLDGLYAEIPEYNNRRTMLSNVAALKGYPTYQRVTKDVNDAMLDANGDPLIETKFTPGVIYHPKAGSEIQNIPMQTGPELFQETLAMEQRIAKYSLSPISKGESPGADTANSSITQLRRLQRSALAPLNLNQSNQYRDLFQFMFARIKGDEEGDIGETVYVYSEKAGEQIDLSPEDIVTLNIQVKVAPDTGQDNLIEEKQAFELWKGGGITELEFHERRGKENPEQFVKAGIVERMRQIIEPQIQTQVLASLGNQQIIQQIIDAQQQGKSPQEVIPQIMQQMRDQQAGQPTGMGSGSPDQGRAMGVRSPAVAETTQPSMNGVQNAPG